MTPVQLTIVRGPADAFKIRAEHDDRHVVANPPAPPEGLLDDLVAQISAGRARDAATAALSRTLGELLFADEVGDLLRAALHDDPHRPVLLATDDTLSRLPWELARDPQTGQSPVANGAGFMRIGGRPLNDPNAAYSPRAVLVIPEARGPARVDALTAATRRLGRRAQLDTFPADPPTGPGLRRLLSSGAALVHVDGETRGGAIQLDDGQVPVAQLGLDAHTWLVVLGGTSTTKDAALTLRDEGVPVILSRQVALQPREAGAIDRELYRALAQGATPLEALRRIRQALLRTEGLESGIWAAPVLWTAPARPDGGLPPAQMVFPPALRAPGDLQLAEPIAEAEPHPINARPTPPMSAAQFVQQTIRMLRDAPPEADQPDLAARAKALRSLGTQLEANPAADQLAPDERITHMVGRFIAALGRPDAPLALPDDLAGRVTRAASACAVQAQSMALAANALLASPAIWLDSGPGMPADAAAIALSRAVFDYLPRVADGADPTPLLGTPQGEDGTGWLYNTAGLNWRRDQIDPFEPEQPDPSTRMPVITRTTGGSWQSHRGVWLIIERADLTESPAIYALIRALKRGVLEGLSPTGRAWRLPIPADLRVIFTGRAPGDLPLTVPIITLAAGPRAQEQQRWLQHADRQLGVATTPDAQTQRQQLAEQLATILRFCRVFSPIPHAVGAPALALALNHAGEPESAVDHALSALLAPTLAALPTQARATLRAYFDGSPGKALSQVVAHSPDAPVNRALIERLAEHLDTDFPLEAPRAGVPGSLSQLDEGRLVVQLGQWTQQGGMATPVACPRLRAHL